MSLWPSDPTRAARTTRFSRQNAEIASSTTHFRAEATKAEKKDSPVVTTFGVGLDSGPPLEATRKRKWKKVLVG